jgi:membrane protein required for colicin V production
MNLLDILVIAIVGYCLVRGIFRGLVKELSSIIGALGGLYAAYTYYPHVAKVLSRWMSNQGYLNILSCLILFFVILFVISIIGVMIKYFMNIVFLGWTDRVGGAFFGTIKGALIVAALVLILTTFLPTNTVLLKDSLAARHMMKISATLAKTASKDMKSLFDSKMKALDHSWRTNQR